MGRRRCVGFGEAGARGPVPGIVGYGGDEKGHQDVGGLCGFAVDDTHLGLVLTIRFFFVYRVSHGT
jgi:hypothetical protein